MSFRDPRTVLKTHGLWTKKQFGQNFLVDAFVVERIVSVSGALPSDIAIEIGAGCGTLTSMIAPNVRALSSIEYDRDLIPIVRSEMSAHPNVDIRQMNVLDVNWRSEAQKAGQPLMLFGNLPYHLSSEIILSLMENYGAWRRACFMVQKEFGERLAAPAGTRQSSSLSVQLQLIACTSVAFYVPPQCFTPPPKVDSCVIIIEPKSAPEVDIGSKRAFQTIVKSLFGQRRKMSRKALKSLNVDVEELLSNAELDGTRRGETFDLVELGRLAKAFHILKDRRNITQ